MDTKDWSGLAAVFAADAEIDMTGEGSASLEPLTEFLTNLQASVGAVTTVHHGHMPEIELTSPTTATGVWAMEDMLWWPEGSPLRHLHGYGHYHETYRKEPDRGWCILSMRLTRLRRDIEFAS